MKTGAVLETNFPGLTKLKSGKVRDIYTVDDYLLIVATDRVSTFDVVLPDGIPQKGVLLTQMSAFWFDMMEDIVPNHVISVDVDRYPDACKPYVDDLRGRSMLVKKADPLPVECIVRGCISGSAWGEYKKHQTVCGMELPAGLVESAKFDEPLFTPSTKADIGEHDENISFEKMKEIIGEALANKVKDTSIAVYERAVEWAHPRGVIIADTKFEFGLVDNELILIDEVLTPDSSRFWLIDDYKEGQSQESLDKQFVRDYLTSIGWDKNPPAPSLPEDVIEQTAARYREAYKMITGKENI